ncbi:MAG: zf-HC2 domain-containing protein [Clostridia bacterium]|nr:zf-HC2 domain-containing protein [Clostridia bacterium]
MKDCGIVKDLLPLYAEDMASEESAAFVKEHLETCEDCRKVFEEMKTPVEAEPAAPLKTVKKAVKKRGLLIAGLIACLVAALLFGAFARLLKPIVIHSAFEAFESVHIEPDRIYLYQTQNTELIAEKDGGIVYVGAYTTLWDEWTGRSTKWSSTELDLNGVDAVLFEPYDGTDHEILYQRDGYPVEAGFALPRLVMNYYFLMALAGTILLAAVWFVLRLLKKQKANRVFGVLLLIAASGVLAFLFAGFPATTIAPARELAFVCVIAALLIGAGLCGRKLLRKE